MNPWYHAKSSSRKWGGDPEQYLPLHEFIDSSKQALPDMRHRAILHSAFGIFVAERVFGPVLNVEKRFTIIQVPTRVIAEQHVLEDLGTIPTVEDWLETMPLKPWMGGKLKHRATVSMDDFLTSTTQGSSHG